MHWLKIKENFKKEGYALKFFNSGKNAIYSSISTIMIEKS